MVDEVEESGEADVIVVEDSSSPEVDNSETVVEAPDAVVDASPTIIVETAPAEETASDSEIDRAVDTAERLTALEGIVGGLVVTVADLSSTASQAQATAETAIDVAVDVVETQQQQVAEEELEEDESPSASGPHWWFESREQRRKRKGKD